MVPASKSPPIGITQTVISMSNHPGLALQLASFATATKTQDLPAVALERAKMSLASTVASTAMGQNIASARIIRDLDLANGGTPDATLWFVGKKLPLAAAARVNAGQHVPHASALRARLNQAGAADLGKRRQADVLPDGTAEQQALFLARFGDHQHA